MQKSLEKEYLERFKQFTPVSYTINEAENYFIENPTDFDEKRPLELLCGLILAASAIETYAETFKMVFLLDPLTRQKYTEKPTLKQIFTADEIVDTDVDCILISDNSRAFIQATRLLESGKGTNSMERLRNLITKKCLIPNDKNLHLAILLDEPFELNTNDLVDIVTSINSIPFGGIHCLGQLGEKPKHGEFYCIEVYPNHREPHKIQLNIT